MIAYKESTRKALNLKLLSLFKLPQIVSTLIATLPATASKKSHKRGEGAFIM